MVWVLRFVVCGLQIIVLINQVKLSFTPPAWLHLLFYYEISKKKSEFSPKKIRVFYTGYKKNRVMIHALQRISVRDGRGGKKSGRSRPFDG